MSFPVTWETYNSYCYNHLHITNKTLRVRQPAFGFLERFFKNKDFIAENLYRFFDERRNAGNSNAYLNHYIRILHQIDRIHPTSWVKELRYFPENHKLYDILTKEEQEKILNCKPHTRRFAEETNTRYSVIIECLLATGLRANELLNLTLNDVQGDRLIIRNTKTRQDRIAKVSSSLMDRIMKLKRHDNYLFSTPRGRQHLEDVNIELALRCKLCGIRKRITNHSLRRTSATESANKGVNLAHIQRFLGHKSVATTATYIQTDENALDIVARSLSVNKDMQNLDTAYCRVQSVAQEFVPVFKVSIKRTKKAIYLCITH